MKNNDLYQQCYYYGKLRTGLRVQRSSDNDIKISDKYSLKGKEFEDSKIQGIITEFSEYSSYSNSFIYVGAKSIDLRDNNGRYDQINHIFLHDEQDDLTDPRSYIRYILPYYYKGEYEPDNDLKNIDIPAINMSCREILDKYNLNGDKNLKKLAKLVMLFYNKLFNSNSLIIALDDNKFCYDDENYNCYRQASEIMLFLHIIVPGCFLSYNTKENLRKKLKYCIVEKVKSNSVCFMPKSCCSGENVFDFDNAYTYVSTVLTSNASSLEPLRRLVSRGSHVSIIGTLNVVFGVPVIINAVPAGTLTIRFILMPVMVSSVAIRTSRRS